MAVAAHSAQLKQGYKHTEMATIPDDWSVKTIGELCSFSNGYGFSPSDWSNEGLPIIRIQNLNGSKEFNFFSGIPDESWLVEPGTILFAWAGTRGVSFGPTIWDGPRGVLNQHIYRIHPNKGVEPLWLYLALEIATKNIERSAHGFKETLVHVRKEEITSQIIPFPPTKSEQIAIATALSDTISLIESLGKLVTRKRDIKQGTMQQLLTGRARLHGFGDSGYRQTEVGIIPDDWDVKQLGDLFDITSSKRVFQSEWEASGVPFYRARELAALSEHGYVNNELFISKDMYATYKGAYGVPKVGDVLVTGVGTLGKVYVIVDNREFYFKDGNIIWLKNSGKVNPQFLGELFLTPLITKQIEDGAAGTTVGTYTISSAKTTVIPYPSLSEQEAIATVLSDMDTEIAALELQRDKTIALKQGMMQELLTGRRRLG